MREQIGAMLTGTGEGIEVFVIDDQNPEICEESPELRLSKNASTAKHEDRSNKSLLTNQKQRMQHPPLDFFNRVEVPAVVQQGAITLWRHIRQVSLWEAQSHSVEDVGTDGWFRSADY